MIHCQALSYAYPSGPKIKFPDIECKQGEQLLVLGESGKGKTTLLHLMAGMLRPSSGSIYVKNQEVTALNSREMDHFRGAHIGIIFQQAHFVSALTVIENLLLPQFLNGKKEQPHEAMAILTRLNVADKAHKLPDSLSAGEKQRVSIARALINKPTVILADEPTSALDDKNAFQVIRLLEEQAQQSGASLVIVTHDSRLKNEIKHCVTL